MQVCTSLQTDNHASTPPLSFLQAGCPSCRPTNSVKALKALEPRTEMVQVERSLNSRLEDVRCRLEASQSSNRTMQNYVHFLKNAYTSAFNDSTLAMNVSPPRTNTTSLF